MTELRTARLLLRNWRESDLEPFAEMNADPEVMRYFRAPLTRERSDALAEKSRADIDAVGWGLWVVEIADDGAFAGFVGLADRRGTAHIVPAVEVGWRLARKHWGRGYATEAARAAVAYGFDEVGLDEIVSFTSAVNLPSRRVMERIGMTYDPADDFENPDLPEGSPLRPHVLYRLEAG